MDETCVLILRFTARLWYIYIRLRLRLRIRTHICMYVYMYICVYIYIHTCIYACICTCTYNMYMQNEHVTWRCSICSSENTLVELGANDSDVVNMVYGCSSGCRGILINSYIIVIEVNPTLGGPYIFGILIWSTYLCFLRVAALSTVQYNCQSTSETTLNYG